jgi:hypothetical protein
MPRRMLNPLRVLQALDKNSSDSSSKMLEFVLMVDKVVAEKYITKHSVFSSGLNTNDKASSG